MEKQAKPMSAAQLRSKLKEVFEYGTVKYDGTGQTFRLYGSMVKAIPTGASHGPLTVTSAASDRAKAKLQEVFRFIASLPGCDSPVMWGEGARYIFNAGTKKEFRVTVSLMQYPTYPRSQNLDPSYSTAWIDLSFGEA